MLGVSRFARRKQAIPTCRIKAPESVRAMLPEGQKLPQKRHMYISKVRSGTQQSLASAQTSCWKDRVDTPVVHAKGNALSFGCPFVQKPRHEDCVKPPVVQQVLAQHLKRLELAVCSLNSWDEAEAPRAALRSGACGAL